MTPDKNQKRKYSIENYDPSWILKFEEIKKMLDTVFGNKALSINHVGSTSIPGMKAKPLIDVLIIVEKKENFEKEKQEMIAKGYEWGENYIGPDTLIFYKTDGGDAKLENIHVCIKDSPKAKQFVIMRDYFRAHPEQAKAYTDLKLELVKKFPDDYPSYRKGKTGFLDEMEVLAYEWKRGE
jgi:GrpB-like predicted nucleotidyltransferase (UPF0157 family)